MSLLTIPYGMCLPFVFPASGLGADVLAGLRILWNPAVILFLEFVWIIMFLRTGRSQVTGAGIRFHVKEDQRDRVVKGSSELARSPGGYKG